MDLEACLPAELRGPTTTITRIAAGLSGAGVYRVEADGRVLVLKIASDAEPYRDWHTTLHIQQLASDAGLAPRIVHVDEAQRAIVSEFVVDRSFMARFMTPSTRELAIEELGQTLRRVHELPLPADAKARDPRAILAAIWSGVSGRLALPAFVGETIRRVQAEAPPPSERAIALCHNDVNPSNLVYDGERILLLDWDTARPNDPWFDLAAVAVFLRMDDATCSRLVAAHDDAPAAPLPARFAYERRLVAAMCGAIFLHLARIGGHAGDDTATLESTLGLADQYPRMRSGELEIASADGKLAFGLTLIKTSASL